MSLKHVKERAKHLKDFVSDGCTGVPDFNFYLCCVRHDLDYYDKLPRHLADKRLRECIKKKNSIFIAWLYYIGVRLLGWCRYYDLPKQISKFKRKLWKKLLDILQI